MKWIQNLSTKSKLFLGFGLMVAIIASLVLIAISTLNSIAQEEKLNHEFYYQDVVNMIEIKSGINHNRERMFELMDTQDPAKRKTRRNDIKDRDSLIDQQLEWSAKLNENDTTGTRLLKSLRSHLEEYRKTRDEQIQLVLAGKIKEAKALGLGIQDGRSEQIRLDAMANQKDSDKKFNEQIRRSENQISAASTLFVVLGIIATILSLLTGLVVIRDITKSMENLNKASQYARSLIEASLDPLVTISAEGKITDVNETTIKVTGVSREELMGTDFSNYFTEPEKARAGYREVFEKGFVTDYPLTLRHRSGKQIDVLYNASVYKDIAGRVLGVFAAARDVTAQKQAEEALRKVHAELEIRVEERTGELAKVVQNVREAVAVLATSASEVLASTTQIASGAAETASATGETSTTVEEVKQTSHLVNKKAKYVADSSQNALKVSATGKKAVEETVEAMNNIHEQMESIAETIVRLSEQSQTIGEIVTSVNSLAEQSNLLAVNAAIEAAKAGDQGRGFAVVAQEIRSLAEQSKQSTIQVRTILNDVQKTISAAVMSTEQGSRAIKNGVEKSKESGESIAVLSETIKESAEAAVQVSTTSQQQLIGMDQVGQAMEQIKQASIQTSSSTKQAETAAKNLHEMGTRLKELAEGH